MEELLRDVLSQLRVRCAEYLSIDTNQIYQEKNSTELDKMRTCFCRTEVVNSIQHIYTIRKRPCQFLPQENEIILCTELQDRYHVDQCFSDGLPIYSIKLFQWLMHLSGYRCPARPPELEECAVYMKFSLLHSVESLMFCLELVVSLVYLMNNCICFIRMCPSGETDGLTIRLCFYSCVSAEMRRIRIPSVQIAQFHFRVT